MSKIKNILEANIKYQYGGVRVIDNDISCGYVFRVIKNMKECCISTNVMSNNNESKI